MRWNAKSGLSCWLWPNFCIISIFHCLTYFRFFTDRSRRCPFNGAKTNECEHGWHQIQPNGPHCNSRTERSECPQSTLHTPHGASSLYASIWIIFYLIFRPMKTTLHGNDSCPMASLPCYHCQTNWVQLCGAQKPKSSKNTSNCPRPNLLML